MKQVLTVDNNGFAELLDFLGPPKPVLGSYPTYPLSRDRRLRLRVDSWEKAAGNAIIMRVSNIPVRTVADFLNQLNVVIRNWRPEIMDQERPFPMEDVWREAHSFPIQAVYREWVRLFRALDPIAPLYGQAVKGLWVERPRPFYAPGSGLDLGGEPPSQIGLARYVTYPGDDNFRLGVNGLTNAIIPGHQLPVCWRSNLWNEHTCPHPWYNLVHSTLTLALASRALVTVRVFKDIVEHVLIAFSKDNLRFVGESYVDYAPVVSIEPAPRMRELSSAEAIQGLQDHADVYLGEHISVLGTPWEEKLVAWIQEVSAYLKPWQGVVRIPPGWTTQDWQREIEDRT